MLTSAVLGAIAVFVGSFLCRSAPVSIAVVSGWGFIAGILVALGSVADIGVVTLVMVIVFAARPLSLHDSASEALLVLGGGLFQTALSLLLWPVRPFSPERRVLGALYLELSKTIPAPIDTSIAPPVTRRISDAQQALSARANDHSVEAGRYRSLLNQAERARLGLLTISRLQARMQREQSAPGCIPVIHRFLELSALILNAIGEMLLGEDLFGIVTTTLGNCSRSRSRCANLIETVQAHSLRPWWRMLVFRWMQLPVSFGRPPILPAMRPSRVSRNLPKKKRTSRGRFKSPAPLRSFVRISILDLPLAGTRSGWRFAWRLRKDLKEPSTGGGPIGCR